MTLINTALGAAFGGKRVRAICYGNEKIVGLRNLIANPSFEATSGTVEVYRNLVTNPSFESTSGTLEVRRNLMVNPAGTDPGLLTGFTLAPQWYGGAPASGTTTYVTGAANGPEVAPGVRLSTYGRKTWTAIGGSTSALSWQFLNGPRVAVTAGAVLTASLYWRKSSAGLLSQNRVVAEFYDAVSGGNKIGSTIDGPQNAAPAANEWQRVGGTFTVPAGATHVGFVHLVNFASVGDIVVGMTVDASAALVEVSPVLLPYFDGERSLDSDLTPAWTAAAHASHSALTGVGVNGVSSGLKVSSTRWAKSGAKSLRIIAGPSFYSAPGGDIGALRNGMEGGKTYTVLGTMRLTATQTGALDNNVRRIVAYYRVGSSGGYVEFKSAQAPNVAGEHEVRLTFTLPAGTTESFFRIFGNSVAGDGDVWWDNVAVVEGTYLGPYFDGNTPIELRRNLASDPAATTDGIAGWRTTRWGGSGQPSISHAFRTAQTDGPEVAPGLRLPTYLRKTWNASPTSNSGSGFDQMAGNAEVASSAPGSGLPVAAGATYTLSSYLRPSTAKTLHLRASFLDAAGVRIGNFTDSPATAAAAGAWTRISLTIAAPASAATLVFTSNVAAGGALWAAGDTLDGTGLLVEASGTLGPYFDGTAPGCAWLAAANSSQSVLYDPDLTPSWTGTANASPSTLTGVGVGGTVGSSQIRKAYSSPRPGGSGRSLRITPSSASLDSNAAVGGESTSAMNANLMAGRTYTIFGTVHLDAPLTGPLNPASRNVEVVYNTVNGWAGATYQRATQAPNVAGEHEVRGTFAIPADAVWAMVRIFNGAAAGGGDVRWYGVMATEGAYTGPYRDGSSPGWYWTGNPNASASNGWQ